MSMATRKFVHKPIPNGLELIASYSLTGAWVLERDGASVLTGISRLIERHLPASERETNSLGMRPNTAPQMTRPSGKWDKGTGLRA
jgi:hypothetical protein